MNEILMCQDALQELHSAKNILDQDGQLGSKVSDHISSIQGGWIGPDAAAYQEQIIQLSNKINGIQTWIDDVIVYFQNHIQQQLDASIEAERQANKLHEGGPDIIY